MLTTAGYANNRLDNEELPMMRSNLDSLVELQLPYGNTTRSCHVPRRNLAEILSPHRVEADPDLEAVRLQEALNHPIGTPRLEEMLRSDQQIAIVIDDIARPTPIARILPFIFDRISQAGVPDDRVIIIIALGTHRPMTPGEIRARVGSSIFQRVRIENHNFEDYNQLVYLGQSSDRTPVWINRHVKEADFRIGIGNIVPHCAAGWSGGGKIIYPGVAGAQTVDGFHGVFGTDLRNRLGADDTPIRNDIEHFVDFVGLEFILNTILSGDGIIYQAVAGNFRLSHRKGVEYAREVYAVSTRVTADIVLVSSYPADVDFWQAGKAVYTGERVLRDGGTMILLTPCPEGIAQNHNLLDYMRFGSTELLSQLKNFQVKDRAAAAAALRLGLVTQRVKVIAVSEGLREKDAVGLGFGYARNLQQAVDDTLAVYGDDCKLGVLTHGGEIFPEYAADRV